MIEKYLYFVGIFIQKTNQTFKFRIIDHKNFPKTSSDFLYYYFIINSKETCLIYFYNIFTNLVFQMQFMLLFSRQGKLRLQKWYVSHPDKLKKKITRELIATVLARKPKMCSFLEWKEVKIVYKRFNSRLFILITI